MATENVGIFIDTKADLKGFKQAETAAQKLNKTVKNLATTIGVAYGARAVANFGKASVKAFAEDQAAATKLTNAVKNLGMAYANPQITKFIKDLETQSGIVDETLRPAFQALLTTTKDLGASYTLLNDAINISRGSGIDLATVSQDLANGYVGITRGLKKYNTGLTQAELKSKSFAQVLGILNKEYAGASSAYLDTYAGKLDVLTTATDNAKEAIGKGLIDAFARLSGGSTVKDAVHNIETITQAINALITGVSYAVEGFVKLYKAFDFITSFGGLLGTNGIFKNRQGTSAVSTNRSASPAGIAVKSQIKASAAQVKATKALTAEQKKQNALKKDAGIFDMQQIQLIAALKGNLSADERKRAELQLALLNENLTEADKLTKQILMAQDATGNLYKYFMQTPDAKNPFAYLDKWIVDFQSKLNSLQMPNLNVLASNPTATGYGIGGTTISPTISSNSVIQGAFDSVQSQLLATGSTAAQAAAGALDAARWTAALDQYSAQTSGGYVGGGVSQMGQNGAVVVQIDGKTIATANQSQSLSGIPSNVSRVNGMFTG
jgi:hypothetical protein